MSEYSSLALALIAGLLLGVIYFAGLWWTVRRGVAAKHVALWFFTSLLLRMSIVVSGFYFILGDDWKRLMAGLPGFMMARLLVMRFTRVPVRVRASVQETRHAS